MNHAVLKGEDVFGIVVQSLGLEKAVEASGTAAVEKNDCLAVIRDVCVILPGQCGQGPAKGDEQAEPNRSNHFSGRVIHGVFSLEKVGGARNNYRIKVSVGVLAATGRGRKAVGQSFTRRPNRFSKRLDVGSSRATAVERPLGPRFSPAVT